MAIGRPRPNRARAKELRPNSYDDAVETKALGRERPNVMISRVRPNRFQDDEIKGEEADYARTGKPTTYDKSQGLRSRGLRSLTLGRSDLSSEECFELRPMLGR